MASILSSVGRGGVNRGSDTETVQNLINQHINQLQPTRPLVVDGQVGSKTIGAIRMFQSRVVGMNNTDGRVDPGGNTIAALNRHSQTGPQAARRFYYPVGPQEELIEIARPYVGAREGHNNTIGTDPRMREIFASDWLDGTGGNSDGYAWCCSFVSMCVQKLIDAKSPIYDHVKKPKTAGVTDFRTNWAPRQQCIVFPPHDAQYQPHKGDVVVFTFSHIGIVDAVRGDGVTTIEGNTNQAGSREGTHVMNKERNFERIRCFIRLPVPINYDVANQMCLTDTAAADMIAGLNSTPMFQ